MSAFNNAGFVLRPDCLVSYGTILMRSSVPSLPVGAGACAGWTLCSKQHDVWTERTTMDFQTPMYTLGKYLERTTTGVIQLPDFQRGYKRDEERVRQILVTVLRGQERI